jgi:hypothetical protein
MNKKLLVATLAALAVVIGAIIFLTREPTPAPPTNALEPAPAETPAAILPTSPEVVQAPVATPATPVTTGSAPSVLATVNGVQITEKDLGPGGGKQSPSSGATQAMLDRAIERELILQAANAQGLSLTAEQQQLVENLRAGIAGSGAYSGMNDPETRDRMQAEIDFRVRDTTAQLLLSTLVLQPKDAAAEGLTAQDQNVRPFLDGLRSTARIEIGK